MTSPFMHGPAAPSEGGSTEAHASAVDPRRAGGYCSGARVRRRHARGAGRSGCRGGGRERWRQRLVSGDVCGGAASHRELWGPALQSSWGVCCTRTRARACRTRLRRDSGSTSSMRRLSLGGRGKALAGGSLPCCGLDPYPAIRPAAPRAAAAAAGGRERVLAVTLRIAGPSGTGALRPPVGTPGQEAGEARGSWGVRFPAASRWAAQPAGAGEAPASAVWFAGPSARVPATALCASDLPLRLVVEGSGGDSDADLPSHDDCAVAAERLAEGSIALELHAECAGSGAPSRRSVLLGTLLLPTAALLPAIVQLLPPPPLRPSAHATSHAPPASAPAAAQGASALSWHLSLRRPWLRDPLSAGRGLTRALRDPAAAAATAMGRASAARCIQRAWWRRRRGGFAASFATPAQMAYRRGSTRPGPLMQPQQQQL